MRPFAHCYRCAYVWRPRRARVRRCARCKSPYFGYAKILVPTYGHGLGIDELLDPHRATIQRLARCHGATNVRVFGSVARRAATSASDVDLLVDPLPGHYRGIDLSIALKHLLCRRVHVATAESLFWFAAPQIVAEAVPL